MRSDQEELRLRIRDDDAQADASQADEPPAGGSVTVLCTTTTDGSYPTTAGVFYALIVNQIIGTESEGSTASFTDLPGKIYGFNLGNAVPDQGTKVEATRVPHRWVFRYDG